MKTRHKVAIGVGGVVLVPVVSALVFWATRAPYDQARDWSTSPADTKGRLSVVSDDWPIASESSQPVQLETVFTIGSEGVADGGTLRYSLGWLLPTRQRLYTPFSLTTSSVYFFGINLLADVEASTDADGVRLDVVEPDPAEHFGHILEYIKYKRGDGADLRDNLMRQIDNEFAVRVRVTGGDLKPGDEVRVVFGATEGLEPPTREAQWQVVVALDGDADGTFGLIEDPPYFSAQASETDAVRLVAPTTMRLGETRRVVVRTEDDYFLPNLTRFGRLDLTLEPVDGLQFPLSARIEAPRRARDRRDIHAPWRRSVHEFDVTAITEGVFRLEGEATVDGTAFAVRSNPIVVSADAPQVYFGDTHLHSILSYDADRPPDYVYWRQRHQQRHDFAFLSDHDMIGTPGFVGLDTIQGRTADEWDYMTRLADEWYEPGEFVTLHAHEWTSYWYGHRNVYYAPTEARTGVVHHNRPSDVEPFDSQTPGELAERLEGRDTLVIPHSTAWPTAAVEYAWGPGPGRFGDPDGWPQQRLIELYSTHGASEHFDNPYAVDEGRPEAPTDSALVRELMNYDIQQAPADSGNFAQDALAAGWRFGFLGSSDMHFLSHIDQAYKYGLAAVVAPRLTREAIWDAMKKRRTYAVTGVRIFLRFTANGHPMGSEIRAPDGRVKLRARVVGTGPLERVQVVRFDGESYGTPVEKAPDGPELFDVEYVDEEAAPGVFYYLKVRQTDGNYAWSSPIWVTK
jgi:hypothetical protein